MSIKTANMGQNNATIADNGGDGIVYRCAFAKGESVRYISHLDTMRTMERAFRKAELPLSYSRGFNPHPSLVFGLPLSVGMSSESDLVDIGFMTKIQPDKMLARANAALPYDIKLFNARTVGPKEKVMADVCGAKYGMLIRTAADFDSLIASADKMLDMNEIMVERFTKQGTATVNIRPLINRLEVLRAENFTHEHTCGIFGRGGACAEISERLTDAWCEAVQNEAQAGKGDLYIVKANVSAGSQANLRADTLADGITQVLGTKAEMLKVHRIELLCN